MIDELPYSYEYRREILKSERLQFGADEKTEMFLTKQFKREMARSPTFCAYTGGKGNYFDAYHRVEAGIKCPIIPAFYELNIKGLYRCVIFVLRDNLEIGIFKRWDIKNGKVIHGNSKLFGYDVVMGHLKRRVNDWDNLKYETAELRERFRDDKDFIYALDCYHGLVCLKTVVELCNRHGVKECSVAGRQRRGSKISKRGWEYKICKIPETKQHESVCAGGTHASPRWHLRRGHYRQLRSGRRVWVRQSEVGSKAFGGIVKDYVIGATQERPTRDTPAATGDETERNLTMSCGGSTSSKGNFQHAERRPDMLKGKQT